ncbi:MAG: S8 family serine peptidase, partial [Caldilineaceae bacterium]|nr:S8 family serine peptidase [Caldilineaceae bacterium]
GTVSGIAPRARIIAYKGLGNQGGFGSDLAAAIDQAVADGVDVINYSVGGGASLTGGDDIAYLFAADAGVFVATSAGNNGPAPATIGGPASVPWLTSVGANTQKRFYQGTVSSSDGWSFVGASITTSTGELPLVDAEVAGDELCTPGQLDPAVVRGSIVLCKRGAIGRVDKSLGVFMAGGRGMILYNAVDVDNLFSDTHWVPSVHIDLTPGLTIKDYIANTAEPTARITGSQLGSWDSAPSMTIFSSRGPDPVALDIIKPDITAPGHQILAGNSPTPDIGAYPSELFQAISGTSMSSPYVAGVFALLKQAHPNWSPAAAKSAIMTTAFQKVVDNDRTSPAGPFAMGAGHVELRRADKGSLFQPGLAYDAGFNDYLGFLCDAGPDIFSNPAATCAALAAAGIPTEAINLNLPSIGVSAIPGKISVFRTVTNVQPYGATVYRADIHAPEGYEVNVEPKRMRLRPGESATFELTIVNKTAPVDEWRFGSITWEAQGDNYEVYSPIAVRGALLATPDAISGTGTEGSASFDVQFGYTGSYTAAPHGLEPAVVINDNVRQDPDQDFDPSDLGNGANVHEFSLSGAAFFRIAIPPEATEAEADLDVFVYDPTGTQVASSTNGGTDELIDIVLPADGVWQVYVHGWQAPGGDSDYSLFSWIVSATPGGSLNVDAAPTTATLGGSGTVEISWSGLAPDVAYLGAVSHSNESGLIGLTLVEVNTGESAAAVTNDISTGLATDGSSAKDEEEMDNHIFIPFVGGE